MSLNATAHRQRRTWTSHLCAQSVLLEKVTSLATDTAVVGVRVFADVRPSVCVSARSIIYWRVEFYTDTIN